MTAVASPSRADALSVPDRTPRPDSRLDLLGAMLATGVAVVVYVFAVFTAWQPEPTASVALFTTAAVAAAAALPMYVVRGRVEEDDAVAWFAVGLAGALLAMVLQLVAFPLVSRVGGPLRTDSGGVALLYLLFHQWLLLGAVAGALRVPLRWRWPAFAVAVAVTLLAALDVLPHPPLVVDDTRFTVWLRASQLVFAAASFVAVWLWLRRVGRVARPLGVWAAVALSLSSYDLVFNALAGARYTEVWWSSVALRAATYVVLAAGGIAYLVAQLGRLERYTDSELGRSEGELRRSLAVTDRLLASAESLSRAVGPREVAQAVVASSLSLTGLPRASVALLDPEAQRLRTIAAVGYDDASLRILRDYSVDAPLPAAVVLSSGEAMFDSAPQALRERFPSWTDLPVHQDTTSLAVLPLRSAGQAVGVLVVSGPQLRPWSAMDREILAGLSAQAGPALQRALLYERQRSAASMLQTGLLPEELPQVPGLAMAARYLPGAEGLQIGGDWYDGISVSGGRVALVVGDVMGKGVRAATRMGQIRTAVRVLAALDPSPSAVVAGLDAVADELDDDQIVTLVYVLVDPPSGTARIARVGHLPPMLLLPDGTVRVVEVGGSPPLGTPAVERAEASFELPPGASLALYTDGLVEDRDSGLEVGLPALGDALAGLATTRLPVGATVDAVLQVLGHAGAARDDVCLLLARRTGGDAAVPGLEDGTAQVDLPSDTSAPAAARRFLRTRLHDVPGLEPDRAETLLLMCSELVTNAVVHASGRVTLRVVTGRGRVRLEVSDASPRLPVRRAQDVAATGGRGMHLVATLADDWGVEVDDGKTVWVETHLTTPTRTPTPLSP